MNPFVIVPFLFGEFHKPFQFAWEFLCFLVLLDSLLHLVKHIIVDHQLNSHSTLPIFHLFNSFHFSSYHIPNKPNSYYQKTGTKQIGIIKTQNITLNQDKTVSGDVTGTWSYTENTSEMTITINGVEYKGYFLKQATEGVHKIVMTFTALGNNVCVWGSKK